MSKRTVDLAGLSDIQTDTLTIKRTKLSSGTNGAVNLTLPSTSGTLSLTSGGGGAYVDLGSNQTITGVKTFSTNPQIAAITADGIHVATIPSTTGTLALTSDIPTNSTYVDLTSTQTITGAKTFTIPRFAQVTSDGAHIQTLPTSTGTFALTSQIPTNSTYVDLTTTQTISGAKTFSTNPQIAAITPDGVNTVTVPTATGTVALTSQIPTNSTYVDLTTSQIIGGTKQFSSAPVIGTGTLITGARTFTLPASTGTLALTSQIPTNSTYVDLTSTQTISGAKTFSTNPQISAITPDGTHTFTIPTTTGTAALTSQTVDLSSSQTVNGAKSFGTSIAIGTAGSTISKVRFGSFTFGSVISGGGAADVATLDLSATFSSIPNMFFGILTPNPFGNWDRVIVTINGASSGSSAIVIHAANTSASATSGTATISYVAIA